MPITLNCPKCHKPFRVRDESIGGRVRCPSCGAVLQVPSALSPASHFGDDPKADGGSASGGKPVAEDYPVGASRMGSVEDVMMGGAGRREGAVDLNPPPGAQMAGPPSIRAHVPQAPAPAPTRLPVQQLPPSPQRPAPPRQAPIRLPGSADPNWGRAAGGLGMIRWALWLCALVFVGMFGHAAWAVLDPDGAMKAGPGFLGKEGWPRWKEVMVAYTAVPLVPAVILLFLGRLRCAGAPAESNARGLARGAAFFTLLGLLGLAAYFGMMFFDLGEKAKIPAQFRQPAMMTALFAAVPSAILADVLTLLYIGQIGWPVGRPRLQRAAASVFVYVALFPAAVLIGHQFYPVYWEARTSWDLSGSPLGGGDDTDLAQRVMIWGVIVLAGTMMFFLRYAAAAGAGRRAVRKFLAGEA